MVWETVVAHKPSCGRTQSALKLNIKQTFVCRSVSASKYRLRSNGRNIVTGINTRNIGCSEFKLISVPSEEVTSKPFFSSLKKTASQFHSSALRFFVFLLVCFSCGYGYLLNSENAVTHNSSGGVSLFNILFEQAFFRLSPLPPSTVHSISKSNMAGQIIDRELLNLNSP